MRGLSKQSATGSTVKIDLSMPLDVEYKVVEDPPGCRHYPVDIVSVKHRGSQIHSLHVGDILVLQRNVYNRLIDSGEIELPPANVLGMEDR